MPFSKILVIVLTVFLTVRAQNNPQQSLIDVSNITTWVRDDGFHDWVINSNWNGTYPNGADVGVVFSEGIVWGGLVHDGQSKIVRVNGNNYGSGCSPITRLYRVRTDYRTADLSIDAAGFFNKKRTDVTSEDIQTIKAQYEKDWYEWPGDKGAPYFDENKDGKYEPDIDVPGVPGAVQTIWIDYNDSKSASLYDSPPIGLEIQETYWAYYITGTLSNVIYKKVDIIYKGMPGSMPNSHIDSMYIVQWSDTDLGNHTDDLVGCDTALNLGYTYNGKVDMLYYLGNLVTPAAGYSFIQGVSKYTGSPSDSAIFNFKWRKGRKYVNKKPMSFFIYNAPGDYWTDPSFNYRGALEYYNFMRGFLGEPHYPYANRFPSDIADYTPYGVYLLDGDPVTGTGKIDKYPSVRSIFLGSGPFNLKLGDTAEVVIAFAGGIGEDNLSSITKLKYNTKSASDFYNFFTRQMTDGKIDIFNPNPNSTKVPSVYSLHQNYPNPFNSTTKIKYELPSDAHVSLAIYDVLGRKIKTLVNEEKPAGSYTAVFNAESVAGGLPSGIYFCKISFDNKDNRLSQNNLSKVIKLILLK